MSARFAGYAVILALFAAVVILAASIKGVAAVLLLVTGTLAVSATVVWAIGAIIFEDWWPFRHM